MLARNSTIAAARSPATSVICTISGAAAGKPVEARARTAVQQLLLSDSPAPSTHVADLPLVRHLLDLAQDRQWSIRHFVADEIVGVPGEYDESAALVALLVVDSEVAQNSVALVKIRRAFPYALVASLGGVQQENIDLVLPVNASTESLTSLLLHSHTFRAQRRRSHDLLREVGASRRRMHQLSEIGIALTSKRDPEDLLKTILFEARRLASCDAASLYLVEGQADERELLFKLTQNDSLEVPFEESRLPLTSQSIAGYVAQTGYELNLDDVYRLADGTPYEFNRSFDEKHGYRTKSMLVLPMRDHRDQVVGVLQFINALDPISNSPIGFGQEVTELMRAVASQAAVSIEKNQLLNDMSQLFESFIQASVRTIERRDPSTSGHSFRVAQTTVALLEALPKSGNSRFSDLVFSPAQITEVRFAALLHDFGKVGVRESVLTKPRKLSDERMSILEYRIELQKERLRRRAVERQLDLLHHGEAERGEVVRAIKRDLDSELSALDNYREWLLRANQPTMLESGDYEHLGMVRQYEMRDLDGTLGGLISDSDLLALSVRRGSLTEEERREMQSHVLHTQEFLATLRWPPELSAVPQIAGAHHEKLDGSGYPQGLVGDQIPLPSKVMTVCDIYDALTAMDRPYKPAMSVEVANNVLRAEAREHLIDEDMVNIFIEANVASVVESSS